jgi:5'-methylthioadenosine phosphorylase
MKIGIIGGSGLDNPDILQNPVDYTVETPWGAPSSALKHGNVGGVAVVLLARHGREHTIPPHRVNYRANIHALKAAGCSRILASTAVGSLREHICRGDLVIIDQFIDWTKRRENTYYDTFEAHRPVHTPMADPFDASLRQVLIQGCAMLGYKHHQTGTLITIDGPRFSTRAESHMFRSFGADIINMSVATEASLAAEAGIPYAAVAMSTDYDCWKDEEEPVSWEAVLGVFRQNADKVTRLLTTSIPKIM